MNILIVKLSAVGDVIHTLPSLAALRRCYPAADITWVVEEAAADLLARHPALNRIIVSRRKTWLRQFRQGRLAAPLREMTAFVRELRQRPYEVVIDFHGLLKSALIVALSGGKRRIGYASLQEMSGLFYNEKIPEDMGKHAVDRYLDLVRYLAGTEAPKSMTALERPPEFTIAIGTEEERRVKALLERHAEILGEGKAPFVSVSPVAFWETKLWEEKRFAVLCDRIRRELGLGIVMTGSEAGPLAGIQERMETQAVNLGGQTSLRELACLYRKAALVVTTDSGPMHLAAA
ncbi:MAG: glycosyltransferase family 9 protein, partial [Syntrophaceae bacterium]|nr:glycosyltransferase family 9 protein [Syntrophaceae bacterium]